MLLHISCSRSPESAAAGAPPAHRPAPAWIALNNLSGAGDHSTNITSSSVNIDTSADTSKASLLSLDNIPSNATVLADVSHRGADSSSDGSERAAADSAGMRNGSGTVVDSAPQACKCKQCNEQYGLVLAIGVFLGALLVGLIDRVEDYFRAAPEQKDEEVDEQMTADSCCSHDSCVLGMCAVVIDVDEAGGQTAEEAAAPAVLTAPPTSPRKRKGKKVATSPPPSPRIVARLPSIPESSDEVLAIEVRSSDAHVIILYVLWCSPASAAQLNLCSTWQQACACKDARCLTDAA